MSLANRHLRVADSWIKATTWQERLEDCCTERDVVEVTRAYLASFDHFEIARLPDDCKPTKLVSSSDISRFAVGLASYRYDENDDSAELIHRLAVFFIEAHMKLCRIVQVTNDDQGGMRQTA